MRSDARPTPESIVIVGNGQVALAAAIALRRTLPRTDVTIVRCTNDPSALADRAITGLPQSNAFHDRLDLTEKGFVFNTGATHRIGLRFTGWRGDATSYIQAYGAFAVGAESVSQRLADNNMFGEPVDDPASPLSDIDYALRHHQPAYLRRLRSLAKHLGVQESPAAFVKVVPDGLGGLEHIALADGTALAASLFVDCSGPQALIMKALSLLPFQSWAENLPCDRVMLAAAPAAPSINVTDIVEACPLGWRFATLGRDGTHMGFAYHHAIGTRAEIANGFGQAAGEVIAFRPGRLETSWVGNAVAFGDAASVFEPLHWINLSLAHKQIALFLELLPGRDIDPLERAEYNRRASSMADRVRDYIALHYAIPHPPEGLFWDYATGLPPSAGLALTLTQFGQRGRWPFFEDDMMTGDAWQSAMACIGITAGPNARSQAIPPDQFACHVQQYQARSDAAMATTTPYPLWLKQYLEGQS